MSYNVDDWVQITHTPDKSWSLWTEEHNSYCNRIGKVVGIYEAPSGEHYYDIEVYFQYDTNKISSGFRYLDFLATHLMRSTQYDCIIQEDREKKEKELQEWEQLSRKKSNEALGSVFSPKKRKKKIVEQVSRSDIPQPIDFDTTSDDNYDYQFGQPVDPFYLPFDD